VSTPIFKKNKKRFFLKVLFLAQTLQGGHTIQVYSEIPQASVGGLRYTLDAQK
jgi:hypothetical protein